MCDEIRRSLFPWREGERESWVVSIFLGIFQKFPWIMSYTIGPLPISLDSHGSHDGWPLGQCCVRGWTHLKWKSGNSTVEPRCVHGFANVDCRGSCAVLGSVKESWTVALAAVWLNCGVSVAVPTLTPRETALC